MGTPTVSLSDQFLMSIVAELDNDDVVGVILGGSHARGDATPWSDVDFAPLYRDGASLPKKRLFYRDDLLVSVSAKTITGLRNDMRKPEVAYRIVTALRECRVLLDKDGSVARLVEEARAFSWEPLREAASNFASYALMLAAEVVHKVVNALPEDALALAPAVAKLHSILTDIVAVQRGVLVTSDRTYYRQVQESVGLDTPWTRLHALAAGIDVDGVPSLEARARAILRLYVASAELLRPIMRSDDLEVAEGAARAAASALHRGELREPNGG